MPTTLIRPRSYLKVRYRVTGKGRIEYHVEANRPVDTFIVDEEGLKEFLSRSGDVGSYYGGYANRYVHDERIRLPLKVQMEGWWYLLISNQQSESVAVNYEVWNRD